MGARLGNCWLEEEALSAAKTLTGLNAVAPKLSANASIIVFFFIYLCLSKNDGQTIAVVVMVRLSF